jgi:hypothetical protein
VPVAQPVTPAAVSPYRLSGRDLIMFGLGVATVLIAILLGLGAAVWLR